MLFSTCLFTSPAALAQKRLQFHAASPQQADAVAQYESSWHLHGERIVCVLAAEVGVNLSEREIEVIVLEGPSRSGVGAQPMHLRASYAPTVKQGALVHELGHRYLDALQLPPGPLSEHQKLDLLLLRVLPRLWGEAFVAPQARAESLWSRDYRRAWNWALRLSIEERDVHWQALLDSSRAVSRSPARRDECPR